MEPEVVIPEEETQAETPAEEATPEVVEEGA